jgi:carbonic anhydrase
MIKVAGAVITHPFGSVMRSILIAVHQLHVQEIAVVGHHDCGMINFHCKALLDQAVQSGVSQDVIDTLNNAGIDLERWLTGFEKVEEGVRGSVKLIRNHPLMRPGIPIHGLVINPETGKLNLIRDGYETTK